jgi:hypothetical protein
MNLQARTLRKRNDRSKQQTANRLAGRVRVVIYLILILGSAFAIANYRISLNDKINRLERDANKEQERLHQLQLEIENLRVKKERLCRWEHIRRKIQEYNLALRLPRPSQVKTLDILDDDREKGGTAVAGVENGKRTVAKR